MNTKAKNIDMCSGNLFKNIFLFSMPLMLSGILQLLYNAADVIVVGRYAGDTALAGVGTSTALISMILNLFIGLSGGVSVAMGRAVGEKNDEKIHKIVHTSIALGLIAGSILTVFGSLFAKNLLLFMDVPQDVLPQAQIYTTIVFLGTIPSLIYNFGAALLNAMGDTKRPLYIITVSGIINVVLNLFFVLFFKMKADGVALATIISQAFSAFAVIIILLKQNDSSKLIFKKLHVYIEPLKMILLIGVPGGIQSMVFAFSSVIIQSSINTFGIATIAGCAAANNIETFIYTIYHTFFTASLTFISQNIGAKKYDRIGKIIKYCFVYVIIAGVISAILIVLTGKTLLGVYCPGDMVAINAGFERLVITVTTYFLFGFMTVVCGALRGMGYSIHSMIGSIAGVCGIRIGWVLTIFNLYPNPKMLYVSFPISWIGTFIIVMGIYMYKKKNFKVSKEVV